MKLVVCRRPETNKDTEETGKPECPSTNGYDQIKNIAKAAEVENVEAVFHSTQLRASIAAQELARVLNVTSFAHAGLDERNFGAWDKWEWSQVASKLDQLSTEERFTFIPPNGESWQQLEERNIDALANIATCGYSSVLVMTHWGCIRAMLPIIRGASHESTLGLEVDYGQFFIEKYAPNL